MACNNVPRLLVNKDSAPLAEHRCGLLATAEVVEDMNPRAFHGVEYETVCAPKTRLYQVHMGCPDPDPATVKHSDRSRTVTAADPFAAYVVEQCLDGRTSQQMQDELRNRLLRGEPHIVETAIYHGLAGASPYLRHPDTALPAGTDPLQFAHAVGALEQWLASQGRTGIIHAPRWLAPCLEDAGLVHYDAGIARTLLGTRVVFGSGYTGEAPEGVNDTGGTWLYATGPVTVRRSVVLEPARLDQGGFDWRTNTAFVLAERVYVIDWPCGTAAVQITLPRLTGIVPSTDTPPTLTITPSSGTAPLDVVMTPTGFGGAQVLLSWVDLVPVNAVTDNGVGVPFTFSAPGTYTVTALSMEDFTIVATATVIVEPVSDD